MLMSTAPWRRGTISMKGRRVEMNRMVADWRAAGAPPPPARLDEIGDMLAERYGVRFAARGVNLYRSGADSVGWHRDRIPKREATLIATLSLGAARTFVLRPHDGGPRREPVDVASGDLLVMGGFCQRDWMHAVPPSAAVRGPRISLTYRWWPGMAKDATI
jgi:alkylated DNA repair dioxygenase AlkB